MGSAPESSIACFIEYMQHTLEQYGMFIDLSRDPAQSTKATFDGSFPSPGLMTEPKGPLGASILSSWKAVTTFGSEPVLYSFFSEISVSSKPVAIITEAASIITVSSFWSKSIDFGSVGHTS